MQGLLGLGDEGVVVVGMVLLLAILEIKTVIVNDVRVGLNGDVLCWLAPNVLESVWLVEPRSGWDRGVLAVTATAEARWLIVNGSSCASGSYTVVIMYGEGVILVGVSQQADEDSGRGDDGDDQGSRLQMMSFGIEATDDGRHTKKMTFRIPLRPKEARMAWMRLPTLAKAKYPIPFSNRSREIPPCSLWKRSDFWLWFQHQDSVPPRPELDDGESGDNKVEKQGCPDR